MEASGLAKIWPFFSRNPTLGLYEFIRNTDEEPQSTTVTQLSVACVTRGKKNVRKELSISAEQSSWKMHEW